MCTSSSRLGRYVVKRQQASVGRSYLKGNVLVLMFVLYPKVGRIQIADTTNAPAASNADVSYGVAVEIAGQCVPQIHGHPLEAQTMGRPTGNPV